MHPRRNEIYLVEIPFSDDAGKKTRPAVVLSRNNYNEKEADVIICGMTTSQSHSQFMNLSSSDLEGGKFYEGSGVRADMIYKVHKSKMVGKVGKITEDYHRKIMEKINELIG